MKLARDVTLTLALVLFATRIGADTAQDIETWLEPFDAARELSGVLLVAKDDQIILRKTYGRANFELDVVNRLDTRFNVASLTKTMTIIIAAALLEQGKFSLDDPISRWLPSFPRGNEITVEHLVQHRSGIPHRVTTPEQESQPISSVQMAAKLAKANLVFDPGSEESYSSGGYTLLAHILELASGQTYAELLDTYVTVPARAADTVQPVGFELMANRADGYFRSVLGPINSPLKHLGFLVGAGSVFSTADDVFRIQRWLVRGGYGAAAKANLLRKSGLRWNGITAGYRTFADFRSDTGITVIWVSNLFTGAGDLMRNTLHRIAAGDNVEPASPPSFSLVSVSVDQQTSISGTYRLSPGSEQPLYFTGEVFRLGEWVLIPIGVDRFLSPQDYAVVRVVREDGAVALQWGEGPRFERVSSKLE